MTPGETIRSYYDNYRKNRDLVDSYVHPDCLVDEPTFLPWGRDAIRGAQEMHHQVGGVFRKVFEPETRLSDIRLFELDNCVISNAIWHMKGKFTGREIACHYQEYFEFTDGKITVIRPFYHAAKEMLEAFAAAEAAGIELTP